MIRDAPIRHVAVSAYKIPTDAPESDGTLQWDSTTLVVVEVEAGGKTGFGYTYGDVSVASFVQSQLADAVEGIEALDVERAWQAMVHATRNQGRPGITSMAIAAVDNALWDLKGKLLGVSVADLLGRAHEKVAVYGSGGFTSYDDQRLAEQLGGWAEDGFGAVKMKVGRDLAADPHRVSVARQAVGPDVEIFVDANGACTRKEALAFAEKVAPLGVTWFEEPVSSNDVGGLRLMRDRAPAGMAISAGEYGYDDHDFRELLLEEAVDVIQADATRCGGITGFMRAAALAHAFETPLSSHCAPALHIHPCAAAQRTVHMEWFHDHVRIEQTLFDGAAQPENGHLHPPERPGLGLDLKRSDAEEFRI
jgi:L-alanine-DL-glutamate epimerase-like enolase superfamily enzyme